MGRNDLTEGAALRSYLAALLACGRIEPACYAGWLTARAAEGGVRALSADERAELALFVLGPDERRDCCQCGLPIPWHEMLGAWDNGSRCGVCAQKDERSHAAVCVSGAVLP